MLARFLQFEKEPSSSNHRSSCCKKTTAEEDNNNKLYAVVDGSYPAFLANAVKQYGDVDVFVMVKDSTIKVFNTLWKLFLQRRQEADDDGDHLIDNNAHGGADPSYQTSFRDMLAVVNFGDVQLIFRYYNCECECDYHVDKNFFKDFHHCTRWKLDVFKDCKVPRYIHLEKKKEDGTSLSSSASAAAAAAAAAAKAVWTAAASAAGADAYSILLNPR